MRCMPVLIFFGSFIVLIRSRPSNDNIDNGFEESDYAENKSDDDSPDTDQRIAPPGTSVGQGGAMNKVFTYEQGNINRAESTNPDISDLKPYGNRNFRNKVEDYADLQTYGQRRQAKYVGNVELADQADINQKLQADRNANYPKTQRIHNNMILDDSFSKMESGFKKEYPNVQGEVLFGSRGLIDKNKFINEPLELNKPYSRYYGPMPPPVTKEFLVQDKNRENDHNMYYNRERRESKDPNPDPVSDVETEKESDNHQKEDEEIAIKKHIKKLSSDELEELLSSLSEEKKQLLKSIMEYNDLTPNQNDAVNKREITKKDGAVEESGGIVNRQSDSNISGESVENDNDEKTTESPSQSSYLFMPTLASIKDLETQMDTDPERITASNSMDKVLLIGDNAQQNNAFVVSGVTEKDTATDKTTDEKPEADEAPTDEKSTTEMVSSDDKSAVNAAPSDLVSYKVTPKSTNKREINIDDLADIVSFEDSKMMDNDWALEDSKAQCSFSHDEDLSQFIDDDQPDSNDATKIYKREIQKQSDYDAQMKSLEESFPKSSNYDEAAGPLIRVKRKAEPTIKKRAAALLTDSKVSFFPYRAENEDEDNDEGNEFDDDGFDDRRTYPSIYTFNAGRSGSLKDVNKDTSNLGSDTDSVLSGVEGEDENLMFSSGSRSRRTIDEIPDVLDESNSIHNMKSQNDESKAVPNVNNIVTYQESDSFGALPMHESGESGRYKRIRRVKQYQPDAA